MDAFRYLTAGESHGAGLTGIVEGCPAGLTVLAADIDADLARRQYGHGRGDRQSIERDRVRFLGGVRYGKTTGAPIAMFIANNDAGNWGDTLRVDPPASDGETAERVRIPRPGHADLGGALLYALEDIRDVIERASARETAMKVACGAVAKALLGQAGARIVSHVVAIGPESAPGVMTEADLERVEADPVRCADAEASARMCAAIDAAGAAGDTLGGVVEVIVFGFPPGVGSYVQGDRRLQSRLAAAVMTVPAMKGVEFGMGFAAAGLPGSRVHDALGYDEDEGYVRLSDNAGGVEGGISTGAPLVLRVAMKPISTLRSPLQSVELGTHAAVESRFERSDVCAAPAAGVVLEAVVALALAAAALERFGGATADEFAAAVDSFRRRIRER